jgi:hypothetical protein
MQNSVSATVSRLCLRLGLPKGTSFHVHRHSASLLLADGVGLATNGSDLLERRLGTLRAVAPGGFVESEPRESLKTACTFAREFCNTTKKGSSAAASSFAHDFRNRLSQHAGPNVYRLPGDVAKLTLCETCIQRRTSVYFSK